MLLFLPQRGGSGCGIVDPSLRNIGALPGAGPNVQVFIAKPNALCYSQGLARLESMNNLFRALPVATSFGSQGPPPLADLWGQHPFLLTQPSFSLRPEALFGMRGWLL